MIKVISFMTAKCAPASIVLMLLSLPPTASAQTFGNLPLDGTRYVDWTIVNYVDRDTDTGQFETRDYTFATGADAYTYDRHDAIDFTLRDFAAMDAGVNVRAAAPGRVELVEDGNFGRCSWLYSCGDFPNRIRIRHTDANGNLTGMATEYLHLKNGSVSVAPGQVVAAGQQIALVGSSGLSSDPHLHFAVFRDVTAAAWQNGTVVETYENPGEWWSAANQITYAGNSPGVLDHGVTNHRPSLFERVEGPVSASVYHQRAGQRIYHWARVHGIQSNDRFDYFVTPPGSTAINYRTYTVPATDQIHYGWLPPEFNYILPDVPALGTWQLRLERNGTTVAADSFVVVSGSQTTWTAGTGNWTTGASWNNGLPNAARDAIIHRGIVQLAGAQGIAQNILMGDGPNAGDWPQLAISTVGSTAGSLNSSNSYIGLNVGTNAPLVSVDGAGSTWTNTGDLIIGYQIHGNLTPVLSITGGGRVTSGRGVLGDYGDARGNVNVSGAVSRWTVGEFRVGNAGIGTLNISAGGSMRSTNSYIGYHPGSSGTVIMQDSGSTWESELLVIGRQSQGTNRLNIQSGAAVSSSRAIIGDIAHALGEVNVTGGGSVWHIGSDLRVGNFGRGTLNILSGGVVNSPIGRVAFHPRSAGTVVVSGTGSRWIMGNDLGIGGGGSGSLFISNGGVVSAPLGVTIFANGGVAGNGTIDTNTLLNSGSINPGPPVTPGLSASTINIDGDYIQTSSGKLRVDLDTGDHGRLNVTGSVTLAGTIEVDWIVGLPFWRPSPGQTFTLLSWTGTRNGTFTTVNLPDPNLGIAWSLQYALNAVLLRAGASGLPGDFNGDGRVDAADYVYWRKNDASNSALPNDNGLTTQADRFNLWRSNFGNMSGAGGESGSTAVPEPSSLALLLLSTVALLAIPPRLGGGRKSLL